MRSTLRKKHLVKKLRRNMTKAEKRIWYKMRNKQLGVKFRRQQPIGKYIVDFVCFENRLVIEIDGGEHFQSHTDSVRDEWFKENGYKVLRFWNNGVLKNTDGVIQKIVSEITPSPSSPPLEGGDA
jgi:very-short-patch-repair endonuclease